MRSSDRKMVPMQTPVSRPPTQRLTLTSLRTGRNRDSPDPHFSLTSARLSVNSSRNDRYGRTSSLYRGFTLQTQSACKDTRNITDRQVVFAMQKKVLKFLESFPGISEKMVKSPTKSEFSRIFEFVFKKLEPNYVLKGKIEDEMPLIFRNLGYPVTLKQSTMQTIGAAHTMPHLLGALTWLIDLISVAEGIIPQELLLANEEGDGQRLSSILDECVKGDNGKKSVKLKYGYSVRCYSNYHENPRLGLDLNNYQKEREILKQLIEEKEDLLQMEAEILADEAQMNEQRSTFTTNQSDVEKLRLELSTAKVDLEALEKYRGELIEKKQRETEKKIKLDEALREKRENFEKLNEDLRVKESQLSAQKTSAEYARSLHAKKEELKNNIERHKEDIRSEKETLRELSGCMFKEATALRDRYKTFLRYFEDVSRTLEAVNIADISLMKEHSPNERNFTNFIPEIESSIESLLEQAKNVIEGKSNEEADIRRQIEILELKKIDLSEQNEKIQRTMFQMQYEQTLKREDWDSERQKVALDVDIAETELNSLDALRNGQSRPNEQLVEMKKELQATKTQCEILRNAIIQEAAEKMDSLVQLWENLKVRNACLKEAEKKLVDAVERFNIEDIIDYPGVSPHFLELISKSDDNIDLQ